MLIQNAESMSILGQGQTDNLVPGFRLNRLNIGIKGVFQKVELET